MDGNSGSDPTRPLLDNNDRNSAEYDGRKFRLTRRNSVNSLRSAFLSMLPDKVRSRLDSESPFDVDLSTATALSQGRSLSLSQNLYLYVYMYSLESWIYVYIGEKEYYEKQFATLKSFEDVDTIVESDCIDEDDKEEQEQQERAMKISNYANIVLLILKVFDIYFILSFSISCTSYYVHIQVLIRVFGWTLLYKIDFFKIEFAPVQKYYLWICQKKFNVKFSVRITAKFLLVRINCLKFMFNH